LHYCNSCFVKNVILGCSYVLKQRKTCSHLQLLTSGGGSKAWAGKFKTTPDKVEFLYDGQGFMSMRLSKTEAHLAFFDVAGSVLHCWDLARTTTTTAAGH